MSLHSQPSGAVPWESSRFSVGRRSIQILNLFPRFCSRDMRDMRFPEDRLDKVADWLVRVAERGHEAWVEDRREEYEERREQAIARTSSARSARTDARK